MHFTFKHLAVTLFMSISANLFNIIRAYFTSAVYVLSV